MKANTNTNTNTNTNSVSLNITKLQSIRYFLNIAANRLTGQLQMPASNTHSLREGIVKDLELCNELYREVSGVIQALSNQQYQMEIAKLGSYNNNPETPTIPTITTPAIER